jgi:M6 family metalloprotease-like protein
MSRRTKYMQLLHRNDANRRAGGPATIALSLLACACIAAGQTDARMQRSQAVLRLNNQLLEMHARMPEMAPNSIQAVRLQGGEILRARAAELTALIQESPREALKLAFSPELLADLRAKFPGSASLLETQGSWQGPAERWVFDNLDKTHKTATRIKTGTQMLDLYFASSEPELACNSVLKVEGVRLGNNAAVTSSVVVSKESISGSQSLTCSTTGVQNTAVLMVTFPGVTPPSYTTAQSVHDAFFGTAGYSLDRYWREASYGQASAAGSVFGWYTLSSSYTCSTTDQMRAEAITLASNAGVNFQNYTRLFVVVPDMGCGWSGAATIGCGSLSSPSGSFTASTSYIISTAWGSGAGTNNAAVLAMHEGGHNLGLNHSRSRAFDTEALGALGTQGTLSEYGDGFTAMSNGGPGHYDAPQKAEILNWLTAGNYQTVQSSGTWTLGPLETPSGGLQALKVQRGTGNNSWLWIEYRQPTGYDSAYANGNAWSNQVFSGATVHFEDSFTTNQYSDLLDFTPASGYGFYDPALAAGQTWTDPYSNVSITIQSATAAGLTLSFSYGSGGNTCSHVNPSVSASPLDPSTSAGAAVNYTLSVTNNDQAACSSSTFVLNSSLPSGWAGTFSPSSVTLTPGQMGAVTMTKNVPSGTAAGIYAVDASAANNTFVGTGSANVTVTAVSGLTASLTASGSSYTKGQTASFTATVLSGATPAAGASVTFTMTRADGSKATNTVTAGSTGKAVWSYKVTQKDPKGAGSVVANATYNSQAAASPAVTFKVQ